MLLPTQSDEACVAAICGCFYAGIPFAPVPIPGRGSGGMRIEALAAATRARIVLAPADASQLEGPLAGRTWIRTDDLAEEAADGQPVPGDEAALALVQFTSGSTADPKGVMLSGGNIIANLEMMRTALSLDADTRSVSWLPLFHDMGLAMTILPLYLGVPGVLMPPLSFLRRPARWLQAVQRYGATVIGAPNFAYDLCAARVTDEEVRELDLRSCRVAFCGSEPVRLKTLAAFAERFAPSGFKAEALFACYGMAEAVTFVSGGHLGRDLLAGAAGRQSHAPVPCGQPAKGSTIAIVDPETEYARPPGETGEIWVAGPHIGTGYLHHPEETRARFGKPLPDHAGLAFLRTGDLGHISDGTLTITGRLKDIIIHRGEKIHAVDVEAAVAASHPALSGAGAAFAWTGEDSERLVLAQEIARGAVLPDPTQLRIAAEDAVALAFGVRLHDLVLVRPGSLPKTTSGKVRRHEARRLYAAGLLERVIPSQSPEVTYP